MVQSVPDRLHTQGVQPAHKQSRPFATVLTCSSTLSKVARLILYIKCSHKDHCGF